MDKKLLRKAVVIGVLVACVTVVMYVVLRKLGGGGGGSMPSWTPSPAGFSFGDNPLGLTYAPQSESPAWNSIPYEWADEGAVPATQMPTTVPTEPSPWPISGPFILPAGS